MILDACAFDLSEGREATFFDVAVIGAGPVGLAVAYKLWQQGLKLVVLEAGGHRPDLDTQNDAFGGTVEPSVHPPLTLYRRRMLGGASAIWGGRCIAFDPSDFDSTSLGDGADWPIAQMDITSYVAKALNWLDAGFEDFRAEQALPGKTAAMIEGVDDPRLSLNEIERFSRPTNAWRKISSEFRKAKSITVLTHCVCTGIISSPSAPRAEGLRLLKRDGSAITLRARTIVVAVGGLETARLLLNSNEGRPRGLGNAYDLVGRFYMTHILADVGTLLVSNSSRVHLNYCFSRDDVYVRRLLKLSDATRRERCLLNAVIRPNIPPIDDPRHYNPILSAAYMTRRLIIPEYRRRLLAEDGVPQPLSAHLRNMILGAPRLLPFAVDWSRRRIFASRKLPSLFLNSGSRFPLEVVAEQAPHRDSRITLSKEKDRSGMSRIKVNWKIASDDVQSMRTTLELIQDALSSSPVAHVEIPREALENLSSFCRPQLGHHIGTARMGDSDRTGASDQWGALWEARNVYLAGSAVFPKSGAANPTLMAVALALRTADEIIRNHARRD